MGFFEDIHHRYGPTYLANFKSWATCNSKLAALRNRKEFLILCRNNRCFPNHIRNGTTNVHNLLHHRRGRTGRRIQNFGLRLGKNILNLEIRATFSEIEFLQRKLAHARENLYNSLPFHIINEFEKRQKTTYNKIFHEHKIRLMRKFNNIKTDNFAKIKFQEKWFKNLTSIVFPYDVKKLLALGPKFNILPDKKSFKISSLLADIEYIILKSNSANSDILRSQCTNVISNYLHNNNNNNNYLNKLFKNCKSFLKQHSNIIITRSDKGNVTVAMYENDYTNKCLELLNDRKYYIELNRNPVSTLQQKANKIVSKLKNSNLIDISVAKKLTIYNAIAPRFYALPKIHKPSLSVRPIVAAIDSPNGPLAAFLTDILNKSYNFNNNYNIIDSFAFSNFINNFRLPENYTIVSFDVVSLFTNLPLTEIINSIKKHWTKISENCSLNLDSFLEILNFIFDSNILIFRDKYYKQIFGTPMGSSISPILCSFVLDDLIESSLNQIPYEIPFVKRFVDDLILAVPAGQTNDILAVFNNYSSHLQFTYESETNGILPFLDMKVHRTSDNKLSTSWYRKPMSSNRFINYYSNHPMKMKTNLVMALKNRVIKLSHVNHRHEDLLLLKNILLENSYPLNLINKLLFSSNHLNQRQHSPVIINSQSNENEIPDISYCSLPFINELTPKLMNIFKKCTNIKIATKHITTLSKLYTKLKSKVSNFEKSNVIYSIPCKNCNKNYIGQTSRNLLGRITSHKSDCRNSKKTCALAEHFINEKHDIDFENAEILATEKNYVKRNFLEMVFINNDPNSMNKRSDIANLSRIYSYILTFDS